VEGEPLGTPEVYSNDRIFVHICLASDQDTETEGKLSVLEKAGHPVVQIEMDEVSDLGAEFFRWELAVATAGAIMGLNPFDEPNVAESKRTACKLLSQWKEKKALREGQPIFAENDFALYCDQTWKWLWNGTQRSSVRDIFQAFFRLVEAPDYIALLPYFLCNLQRHQALQTLRNRLRERFKVATTLGYGPPYLHETGQLHKGGPKTGVFLIFTADTTADISIPEQEFGFATLQRAQALGDFRSLTYRGQRVIRVHLGRDIEKGLKFLEDNLR
jgi:hypothetical protein